MMRQISSIGCLSKILRVLSILINKTIHDAIGDPGVPSDLEMMIYTSKRLAATYERLVGWALYFKSLHADEIFANLLDLLYDLPKSALGSIDDFVENLYQQITSIPDVEDHVERNIQLNITLDNSNLDEINKEIIRLTTLLR